MRIFLPFLVIFLTTTLISFTKLRFSGHFEVFYFKDINVVGGKMTRNGHKMRRTITIVTTRLGETVFR
jgi:hypothetical protein